MAEHNNLGNGFLESIYKETLEKEFIKRKMTFKRQHKLHVYYEDEPLNKYFKAYFLFYNVFDFFNVFNTFEEKKWKPYLKYDQQN